MSSAVLIAEAISILTTGNQLAGFAIRALDAATNDQEDEAKEYLRAAQTHYEDARSLWNSLRAGDSQPDV